MCLFYTHSLHLWGFFYFSRCFFCECPLDVSVPYFLQTFFLLLPPSIIWSVSTCDIQVMSVLYTTFILRSLQCIWRDHLRGKTQCFFLSLAISSLKKQKQTNKNLNLFQPPTQVHILGFFLLSLHNLSRLFTHRHKILSHKIICFASSCDIFTSTTPTWVHYKTLSMLPCLNRHHPPLIVCYSPYWYQSSCFSKYLLILKYKKSIWK